MPRLDHIIEKEKIVVDKAAKDALLKLSKGDMRRAINILQVWLKMSNSTVQKLISIEFRDVI